jgi:hypothetical protein
MKVLLALLFFLPIAAQAVELKQVKGGDLAAVLGLLDELTPAPSMDQPYFVRVYAVPAYVGECGGSVSSCPDVRLYLTVSSGDLGETPRLYRLPDAKGWEFKGWSKPAQGRTGTQAFTLLTTLPESNIEQSARKAWRAAKYQVVVGPSSVTYTRR